MEWLGDIPAHWDVQRLGLLFSESNARASSDTEKEYPILSVSIHDGISDTEMSDGELDRKVARSKDRSLYKVVHENDLAYNMMRAWQGGFGSAKVTGLISPAYVVCRPKTVACSAFFEQVLRTPNAISELRRYSRGITDFRLRLYWDDFKTILVPVPPETERKSIQEFLDYETAKIDALIEKQQQLIDFLKEKREGLLHVAISEKGTKKIRLENCWEIVSRPITRLDSEIYHPIGLLNRGRGVFHKDPTLGSDLGDSDFFYVEEGDLILSGQFAWEGAVALAGEEESRCVATHRYPIVRSKPGVTETAFLWALFASQIGHFLLNENSRGAAGRNRPLNMNSLMKEKILVPPLEAQQAVAKLVLREKALREYIQQPIALLQERRTALISAAVTGKIDVRGWKAPDSQVKAEVA
ncbi:MAG: restriction endonuclease subunit S [Acidobacteriota bacterium]